MLPQLKKVTCKDKPNACLIVAGNVPQKAGERSRPAEVFDRMVVGANPAYVEVQVTKDIYEHRGRCQVYRLRESSGGGGADANDDGEPAYESLKR
jgi:hypothetical protein